MTDATGASPPTIELGAFKPDTVVWSSIERKTDVLLMTVNENEFHAVARIIPNPQRTDTGGSLGPIYRGKIGENYVSLVRSSPGSIGNTGSTATCQDVIEVLKPNVIVLLGVCFGLKKNKQSLGDLLIAKQMAFYATGRYNKDGSQHNRAPQPECDARLQRVFKDGKITWTPPRDVKTKPKVHFGLVLSGPKLIDNEEETRRLKIQFPEALGGEMEAEGIYSLCERKKIPWILCKAICDWADGTKVKEWQPYAAAVSASFVRNVLEQTYLPETKSVSQREQQMPIEQDFVDRGDASSSDKAESSKSGEASISLFKSEVQESCSRDVPEKVRLNETAVEGSEPNTTSKVVESGSGNVPDPNGSTIDESQRDNRNTDGAMSSEPNMSLNFDEPLVKDIPYQTRADICKGLNLESIVGQGDYRTLAGLMGMTNCDVQTISKSKDPADELLSWWQPKISVATVAKLREFLLNPRMNREDLVKILDSSASTDNPPAVNLP